MLRTKSILHPIGPDDGLRISVMSRHTLRDGKTPDPRITPGSYHEHWQQLGPDATLIGDYYKRGLTWDGFDRRFRTGLYQPPVIQWLDQLIERARYQDVTILCIECSPEKCHRSILAEECQRRQPLLRVQIA